MCLILKNIIMPIENNLSDEKTPKKRMKRTFDNIRTSIMSALNERPMNTHEICKHTDVNFSTVIRHLNYLEAIHKINKTVFRMRDGKDLQRWTLLKE